MKAHCNKQRKAGCLSQLRLFKEVTFTMIEIHHKLLVGTFSVKVVLHVLDWFLIVESRMASCLFDATRFPRTTI